MALLIVAGSARAQQQAKLVIYNDAIYTPSNKTVTASSSATDESIGMGPGDPCNHYNYQTCNYITPPDGVETTSCVAGMGTDNEILVGESFGEYESSGSASATCSCIGPFGGGDPPDSVDVPGITALQDYSAAGGYVSPFTPAVDTPQNVHWLMVYGGGLSDDGMYSTGNPPPTTLDSQPISGGWATSGGFHLGTPSYVSDTLVQYPYYVDASASVTSHTITITTPVGAASATFSVGDDTPVISSITPNSFIVNDQATVTITGRHFGSPTCPTLAFPFAVTYPTPTCTDTNITLLLTPTGAGSGSLTLTSKGYNGQSFDPQPGNQSSTTASISAANFSLSIEAAPIYVSTGDTSDTIGVSGSPSSVSFSPTLTVTASNNPTTSTCESTLSFSSPSPGSATVYAPVTASGGSGSCSGFFTVQAGAYGATSTTTEVIVPPQIMIQTAQSEAGGQTSQGDETMEALLLTAQNRFGDPAFGTPWTWYAAFTAPLQYTYTTTANGPQPELNYAGSVFAGTSGVNILNCEGYWSPLNSQWTTLQQWYNLAATSISDSTGGTSWSAVGAPTLWKGQPKQAVVKGSVLRNVLPAKYMAPAIVLFRPAPNSTDPAVIAIP